MGNFCAKTKKVKKDIECHKNLKWTKSHYSSYSIDSIGTKQSEVSKEDEEEEDPEREMENQLDVSESNNPKFNKFTERSEVSKDMDPEEKEENPKMEDPEREIENQLDVMENWTIISVLRLLDNLKII